MNTEVTTIESTGSLTLIREFGAGTSCTEIRWNGLRADHSVTLYEIAALDGPFYALTTNGDPTIWLTRSEMREDLYVWALARLSDIGQNKPLENEGGDDLATEKTCFMVAFADADDVTQWASGR